MHIKPHERDALDQLDTAIERARSKSKQPRFGANRNDPDTFFSSALRWVSASYTEEPSYAGDSRARDKWLSSFWRQEPHLAGVMSSVNSIDSNRGWTLTGGRNQVMRFLGMFRGADDGGGWRQYISQQSQSFYSADIGAITECGRDGMGGPLREIFHVDPTRCSLTGKRNKPLKYDNNKLPWGVDDFFRIVSMKDIREDIKGLGFCAVSRCLEMSKIMLALYGYQLEQLGAKAPRGLLLLQNIDQDQWVEAMKSRDAALDSKMRKYYEAVAVIAQMGFDTIDAKLIALSNLPEGFDLEMFTNLLMYTYALCFGYDSTEFWPGGGGAIGRGRETDLQHRKGTGKGGSSFMLAYQEQMAEQLPNTLSFDFEERDPEGDLLEAAVAQAWSNVVATLFAGGSSASPGPAGPKGGSGEPAKNKDTQSDNNPKDQRPAAGQVQQTGMITRQEARQLLAMKGVIPMSWTEQEEDVAATDTTNPETERDKILSNERVLRAIYQYPDEPIVQYNGRTNSIKVLFNRSQDALAATRFTLLKPAALIPDFSEEPVAEEAEVMVEPEVRIEEPLAAEQPAKRQVSAEPVPETRYEDEGVVDTGAALPETVGRKIRETKPTMRAHRGGSHRPPSDIPTISLTEFLSNGAR